MEKAEEDRRANGGDDDDFGSGGRIAMRRGLRGNGRTTSLKKLSRGGPGLEQTGGFPVECGMAAMAKPETGNRPDAVPR